MVIVIMYLSNGGLLMLTIKEWFKTKIIESNMDKIAVYELYPEFCETYPDSYEQDSYKRAVRKIYNELLSTQDLEFEDEEATIVKLEAQRQGLLDKNTVARKVNRESFRIWNALEATFSEYIDLLQTTDLTNFKITEHNYKPGSKVGILQLSDLHMNEWISADESLGNTFNFDVASKRLKKYAMEATALFQFYKIDDVTIFMTGDFINSNRRLSEKFASITSQTRASLLTTYLLEQLILDLAQNFAITVEYVVGNESRMGEDFMDSGDLLSSENFDFLIVNSLRQVFKKTAIKFNKPQNNIQTVARLQNGFNALLMHGHLLKGNSLEKAIVAQLTNYLYKGIVINGTFSGHLHNASIGDISSRSSSLCGSNSYSAQDLGFMSRASQNIYIVNADKGYHGIKIDLQNTDGIVGYDIKEELEFYNIPTQRANTSVTITNLV